MGAAGLLGLGQSVPHRRSRAHPPPPSQSAHQRGGRGGLRPALPEVGEEEAPVSDKLFHPDRKCSFLLKTAPGLLPRHLRPLWGPHSPRPGPYG